jgi:hypothetical protein
VNFVLFPVSYAQTENSKFGLTQSFLLLCFVLVFFNLTYQFWGWLKENKSQRPGLRNWSSSTNLAPNSLPSLGQLTFSFRQRI